MLTFRLIQSGLHFYIKLIETKALEMYIQLQTKDTVTFTVVQQFFTVEIESIYYESVDFRLRDFPTQISDWDQVGYTNLLV